MSDSFEPGGGAAAGRPFGEAIANVRFLIAFSTNSTVMQS